MMNYTKTFFKTGFALIAAAFLTGCATINSMNSGDPRDPWESTNRVIFKVNETIDGKVLKPLAEGYQNVVPSPIRTGVSNFFSNLSDLATAIHHLLQLDFKNSGQSVSRFVINSTMGILGLTDVASNLGINRTVEDTGQTLGSYGVKQGPYLVLPLFGPSTVRDGLGRVVDLAVDPFNEIVKEREAKISGNILRVVDTRAQLLAAEEAFEALAFDRYVSVRNAYLAIRESQVKD
ncbi:MAG: hypothetical protein CBC42_01910 [Betaproteobacteria bacterium TMED82]|nr:MAG: hypothetical protein CBC42_01910 [Betaproteobacteria bacterium TMED82]|tara:strand:+ start:4840 stop:5541 length:702 start_codon:yes stop_codon:yes gene_type:complete